MVQVTDKALQSLKPRAPRNASDNGRYEVFYDDGLCVRVSTTGRRTFVYLYRTGQGDKKRRLTLGEYPHMTVKQAIAAHKTARAKSANGIDPATEKQEHKAEAIANARAAERAAVRGKTFRQVFDHWVKVDLAPNKDAEGVRHGRKDGGDGVRAAFERRVFDKIGNTPIRDLGKAELLEIVDDTKAEGKHRMASVLFSSLRQMLDFAVDRDHIDRNPLATVKKHKVVGKAKNRTRVLADWELTRLLCRLPLVDLHVVTVLALRFVLATGQRPGEVSGMTKVELSKAGDLWTIPAERYKTGEEHKVPLSTHARGLLAQAAIYNAGSAHVFPSPQWQPMVAKLGDDKPTDRPIDRHSLSRAILRKLGTAKSIDDGPDGGELGLEPFTPHDLRRTCRTGLAMLGVPSPIAERVIGHKLQGMESVYNQHDYLAERREALERWGQKLAALS